VHDGAGFDDVLHKAGQGCGRGVLDDLHPKSSGTGAADLDRHKGFGAVLAPAAQLSVQSADEALVDLDSLGERGALGVDHGAAELLQHHPGRLVPANCELPLQLRG
jgi:hypothetical protein